jgi:two-component sensor histidine kinase
MVTTPNAALPDLSSLCLEHAPSPMARLAGPMHVVRYINSAFCKLIEKTPDDLAGKPFREIPQVNDECLALLDRVYRTGKPASHTEQPYFAAARSALSSFTVWPVMADERTVGVVIQLVETVPLHEKTLAMNEALVLGSLRQHELAAAADASNIHLQTEIGEREQSEREARMMTMEVSHRVKNNLQFVVNLIGHEATVTAPECAQGYSAMQSRIEAIADLYDLISQSSRGQTVPVDAYLGEIAKAMSASLLADTSGIKIVVKAEALDIDPDRAVPFGLLVNELTTNAIKHAFPEGKGHVALGAERIGDQIELTVADSGVGLQAKDLPKSPGKHGSDYVAIFVRQLGGTIAVSGPAGAGTIVRIRFPLLAVQ